MKRLLYLIPFLSISLFAEAPVSERPVPQNYTSSGLDGRFRDTDGRFKNTVSVFGYQRIFGEKAFSTATFSSATATNLTANTITVNTSMVPGSDSSVTLGASGNEFLSIKVDTITVAVTTITTSLAVIGASNAGNVSLGTTTLGGAGKLTVFNPSSGGASYAIRVISEANQNEYISFDNGSVVGSVTRSGASNVAYNTSSDERLKTDFGPSSYGLSRLRRIKVQDFSYRKDGARSNGFVAQDLVKHYPFAVTIGEGERPWMVDYGRITPLLVKSIQELAAENEKLKKRIEALEKR